MNVLLPLRSLGDFVIDAHITRLYSDALSFSKILLPGYLRFLSPLAAPQIEMGHFPFSVKSNVLSFFTYRHFLSGATINELRQLRHAVRQLSDPDTTILLQVGDARNRYLQKWLGRTLHAPNPTGPGVYHDRLALYTGKTDFLIPFSRSKSYRHVTIFPDSRMTKKELRREFVETLVHALQQRGITAVVAAYGQNPGARYGNALLQPYMDIQQLQERILATDLVISCDSMPVHLANYLAKDHFCVYNQTINHRWTTPFMNQESAFCISENPERLFHYIDQITTNYSI